jgi:hypothetical protein
VVLLLTLPGLYAAGAPSGSGITPSTATPVLLLQAGHLLSNSFWGATVEPRAHLLPNEPDLVNATPVGTILWPGAVAGDLFNPFNESVGGWVKTTPHGAMRVLQWTNTSQHGTSVQAFVAWCESINCTAIFQVPGEIDNATFARDIVAYTVNQTYNATTPGLDFRPAYWEIGNEPGLWNNWGLPWSKWVYTNAINVTPIEYAWEVHNYTAQMDLANSTYTPKIIGLPGIGKGASGGNGPWSNDTIQVNGPNLSGVAIHVYPANGTTVYNQSTLPTLAQFYDSLEGTNSLGSRISVQDRATCRSLYGFGNPTCEVGGVWKPTIPTFVTEVGSSLSHDSFGPYSEGFPGALGLAVEMTQAMAYDSRNLTSVDLFASTFNTTNSWFNLTGTPRPAYMLYSSILSRLGNDVFNVNVTQDSEVSAVATVNRSDGDRVDLLVTNTELNSGVTFPSAFINATNASLGAKVRLATFTPGEPVEEWGWSGQASTLQYSNMVGTYLYNTSSPVTPAPVPIAFYPNGLPPTINVPAQSLVLFETYNAPAAPVNFSESGLRLGPSSTTPHWFLKVNGTTYDSNQATITLLLKSGSYATGGAGVLIPQAGFVLAPVQRYLPTPPSPTVVGTSPGNVTFGFVLQSAVTVSWAPAYGTVDFPPLGPDSAGVANASSREVWLNRSQSMTFEPVPVANGVFTGWSGEGSGDHGVSGGNGSFSGYGPNATVVSNGPILEQARFTPGYSVMFAEKGLPLGTPWTVWMRGFEARSTGPVATLYQVDSAPSNSWAYTVPEVRAPNATGNLTTFRVVRQEWNGTFANGTGGNVSVSGAPVVVHIEFVPVTPPYPEYPVNFLESGLPAGATWSLTFNGETSGSITSTVATFMAANTTGRGRGYEVPMVYVHGLGYRFVRGAGDATVHIHGAEVNVSVVFNRTYAVTFVETGLPTGQLWSLVVAPLSAVFSASNATTGSSMVIQMPNGTWGFHVANVSGYQFNWWDRLANVSGGRVLLHLTFTLLTPPGMRYPVTFAETGLPVGTLWTVSIALDTSWGSTTSSEASTLVVGEPNGTWGYSISNVSGYQFDWWVRSLTVHAAPLTVDVNFTAFTPPGPYYPVTFDEVGLPSDSAWHVTVRNFSGSAATPDAIVAEEHAGRYSFTTGAAGGYNVSSPLFFDVPNSSLAVTVVFRPGNFVLWNETGLGPGLTWSVRLNGSVVDAKGGWTTAYLFNGTDYRFTLPVVQGYPGGPSYVPSPRVGTFDLSGGGVTIAVRYIEATAPVTFQFTGLTGGGQYQVRLSNATALASVASYGFQEPNGTYTYDVVPPAGYFSSPSHGTVVVNGSRTLIAIAFLPIGRGPTPPFLVLVLPAAATAVVLILSGVGMFALLGAIRRRRTGAAL